MPQNAPAGGTDEPMQAEESAKSMSVATPAAPPPSPVMRAEPKSRDKLETIVVTGSRIERSDIIDHYSQNTVVQTGKGMPSWNLGSTAWLSWSGPVVATQSVRLLIAPPWLVRPLRLVLVALLAWLILQLVRNAPAARTPRGAAFAVSLSILALRTSCSGWSTRAPCSWARALPARRPPAECAQPKT